MRGENSQEFHEHLNDKDSPTLTWLPSDNFAFRSHLKHIRNIINRSPHNTYTALATKEIENDLTGILPDKEFLDDWKPSW